MNDNKNNLNSDALDTESKINYLQNEIDYLNSQIIDMFNSVNTLDTFSGLTNEIIKVLKGIIITQREEIMLKNQQIKKFEKDFNDLIAEINLANDSNIKKDDDLNIGELNKTIEELLKKNADNQEIINKLREESNTEFWENKISELNKEIIDLNDENTFLRDQMAKSQKNQINEDIEKENLKFKKQIDKLEDENNKLEEKNRMLKAALLMTVDTETKNITDSPESLTEDTEIGMKSEYDNKGSVIEGPSYVRSQGDPIETSERKRQCPKCGASGAFILEIDDKSTIIYQDMGSKIYGKKYKCGDCRYEWK